jgi:hypothetical protein
MLAVLTDKQQVKILDELISAEIVTHVDKLEEMAREASLPPSQKEE